MKQFKRHRDYGFFDQDIQLSRLRKELFDLFTKELNLLGLIVDEGKIIDASFDEVSR